jgi:Ca2+-binding EF-hand superfamily protein
MTYDEDKKGALDKDEAKSFVRVAMSELGSDPPSKEEIEEDFEAYDSAKTIEKSKIVEYIRKRLIADKILKEPVSSPPEVKENK